MKYTRAAVLSAFLVFLTAVSFAEDFSGVLNKIKNHYASFDQKVNDMTMTQEMKIDAGGRPMVQVGELYKKKNKFRMNSKLDLSGQQVPEEMAKMETTIIFDGKNTWMISPFLGKKMMPKQEARHYASQQAASFLGDNAKITGVENMEGRDSYVVENVTADGEKIKLWLDKNSYQLIAGEVQDENGPIRWTYSDFRNVPGAGEMPYKTVVTQNGKTISTVTIDSVKVNTGLSDDLFNPDNVSSKGFDMQSMMQSMMPQGQTNEPEETDETEHHD
jgi:zinc protease